MASVPLPIGETQAGYNDMMKRLARNFRARPATSAEEALIDAAVSAFSTDYDHLEWRFFGKWRPSCKLRRLGQIVDDVKSPLSSSTLTSLQNLFNGLDIYRFVG